MSAEAVCCPVDGLTFGCEAGIWHFLPPKRAEALAQFRREYETVRQWEGRGSDDPAYYRALPFVRKNGTQMNADVSLRSSRTLRSNSDWAVRARSFEVLVEEVIRPLEMARKRPLRILDLGAGNGWLSNRLAARGHQLAAVDLAVNERDGLGAQRHYDSCFTCLQAEFDHLPLDDNQADLVIFNASFHYSVNYEVTLREALRVLRADGWVVVLDTAVYQHQASGQQMVAERERQFKKMVGFASNALPSENFLTPARLNQLVAHLNLHWRAIDTVPRWRRLVRWLKVALRGQREPAQFPIIIFATEPTEKKEGTKFGKSAKSLLLFPGFSKISVSSVAYRVGRNSVWLFGARVGQQGILLLFTALVARQLGEVGLGQLAWVTAVLYVGNVFSTFGLDTVLLRQIAAERRTDSVPLASTLALELILAAIFITILWFVPLPGQTAATVTGLRLYAWVLLPLAFLTLTNAALRGYERMGLLAALTLGTAVLQLVGAAVLFVAGGGFQTLLLWLLAVQIVAAGASWWLCRWKLPEFGINLQLLSGQRMRQLAGTGFWLALLMVTAVFLQRLGILLLGWLGTEAQTGQLAAALRPVEAVRLLPGAVMGAVFPALARQKREISDWRLEMGDAQSSISNLQSPLTHQRWLVVYGLFAAGGLTLLARPLVNLLFGGGYETAVVLLRILALGVVPFTISLPLSVQLVVAGAEKWVLLATFLTLLGTAVLATIVFTGQGLIGLALSLATGEWLLVVALVGARYYLRRNKNEHS